MYNIKFGFSTHKVLATQYTGALHGFILAGNFQKVNFSKNSSEKNILKTFGDTET